MQQFTNAHKRVQVHREYVGAGQFDWNRRSFHDRYQALLGSIIENHPVYLEYSVYDFDALLLQTWEREAREVYTRSFGTIDRTVEIQRVQKTFPSRFYQYLQFQLIPVPAVKVNLHHHADHVQDELQIL